MPVPAFESSGYLPPGRHVASPTEMEAYFVVPFTTSTSRPPIFDWWRRHRAALRTLVAVPRQWIGGSFVSAKPQPQDIDVCSFLDGPTVDALPEERKDLIRFMVSGKITESFWHVDSYPIVEYPVGSPHRQQYEKALQYWSTWWGSSRPDASGVSVSRGYLEIQ